VGLARYSANSLRRDSAQMLPRPVSL